MPSKNVPWSQNDTLQAIFAAVFPKECGKGKNKREPCVQYGKQCSFSHPRLNETLKCCIEESNATCHGKNPTEEFCHCEKFGIVCERTCREGDIVGIQVHNDCGRLPSAIGNLPTLQTLQMRFCQYWTSSIPSQIGKLSALDRVYIDNTPIKGDIPTTLGNLWYLGVLTLSMMELVSTIPTELGRLWRLHSLEFKHTNISGRIPTEIGWMRSMTDWYTFGSPLTSTIPSQIGHVRGLQLFDVGRNKITGILPTELSKLRIVTIIICKNSMQGSIPRHSFSEARHLSLARNSFTGSIEPDVGNIAKLLLLYADRNRLTGKIPTELAKCKYLLVVILGENRMTGSIPRQFRSLTRAIYYGLHRSGLQGSIPPEFIGPQVLTVLLHGNYLQGEIPTSLQRVSNLGILTIHDNSLQGRLPPINFTCNEIVALKPLLTLHGNRLSCTLPPVHFTSRKGECWNSDSWRSPVVSVVLGNSFSRPLPSWVPKGDSVHIAADAGHISLWLALPVTVIIMASLQFMLKQTEPWLRSGYGQQDQHVLDTLMQLETTQRLFSVFIMISSVVAIVGLLPLYMLYSDYYECGKDWIKTTAALLHEAPIAEYVVGFVWAFLVLASTSHVHALCDASTSCTKSKPMSWPRRCKWILYWCVWLLIMCVLGLPGILYAISKSLPKSNVISVSLRKPYYWFSRFAPVLMYVSDISTNRLTSFYSKISRIDTLQLKCFGRTWKWCVIPVTVTGLCHENCAGLWRLVALKCLPGDHTFDVEFYGTKALTKYEMCHGHSWLYYSKRGRCGRSIIETLAPLLLKKAGVSALLSPLHLIIAWAAWKHKWWKSCLKWTKFHPVKWQLKEISSWTVMAVLWGPLIPLLLPMIAIGLWSNCLAYRACVKFLGWPEVTIKHQALLDGVRGYLMRSPLVTTMSLFVLCLESRLRCGVSFGCGMAVSVLVFNWRARRCKHTNPTDSTTGASHVEFFSPPLISSPGSVELSRPL